MSNSGHETDVPSTDPIFSEMDLATAELLSTGKGKPFRGDELSLDSTVRLPFSLYVIVLVGCVNS